MLPLPQELVPNVRPRPRYMSLHCGNLYVPTLWIFIAVRRRQQGSRSPEVVAIQRSHPGSPERPAHSSASAYPARNRQRKAGEEEGEEEEVNGSGGQEQRQRTPRKGVVCRAG